MSENIKYPGFEVNFWDAYPDSIELFIPSGGGYYDSDKELCISKPDAIALARRILEHYESLPTREEIEFICKGGEVLKLVNAMPHNKVTREELKDACLKDGLKWQKILAKLQRLIEGEGE